MAKYNLQPNEAVLRTSQSVMRSGAMFANYSDELVLTNMHIIWVNKGPFGNVKKIEYFPLGLVKVHNEQAQALETKSRSGTAQLEVFFQSSQEGFSFSEGTKEIKAWIAAINTAVTGKEAPVVNTPGLSIPGSAFVADALKGTFDQFRTSFGGGQKTAPAPAERQRAAGRCLGCSAAISGFGGTTSKCEYCDTETLLS